MNASQLLDNVLKILYTIKENKDKLEKVLQFLEDEIYDEPEEIEIPERYKNVVSKIADSIDAGFICYLNPETLAVEETRKRMLDDLEEFEDPDDESEEIISSQHDDWRKCIIFEPLESYESFQIMEQFAEKLEDEKLQNRLFHALGHRRPFSNFKAVIDNSSSMQNWFDFKKYWLENHVKELLMLELEAEPEFR